MYGGTVFRSASLSSNQIMKKKNKDLFLLVFEFSRQFYSFDKKKLFGRIFVREDQVISLMFEFSRQFFVEQFI
jgi:hypothetical protein